MLNPGNGNFSAATEWLLPSAPWGAIPNQIAVASASADFNGDGRIDLLVTITRNYMNPYLQILINKGDGSFDDESATRLPLQDLNRDGWMVGAQLVDINGDGHLDILAINNARSPLFINDGTGHFHQLPPNMFSYPGWDFPKVVNHYAADVNGDGRMDVLGHSGGHLIWMLIQQDQGLQIDGTGDADGLLGDGDAETFHGGDSNDVVFGGAGNDLIDGEAGDDRLIGGAGDDTMTGGAGNDLYVVDSLSDTVTELAGEGTDEVWTALANFSLMGLPNVENLTGAAATGQTLAGNAGNNVVTGGAGNDLIDGGAGDDTMAGGLGNDVFVVDSVSDIVNENAGGGTDEIRTALAVYSLAGLAHVENLTGTGSTGQTLTGNGADNVIDGGAGADSITGGTGNDTYIVDNGGDTVTELVGEGTDEVRTALTSYILPSHVENLTGTSTGSQILRGNDLANVVTAGAGGDLIYLQDGGNDHALSGFGNDAFIFGTTLTAEDSVDGGAGDDQLGIQGNYVLTLGSGNLVNIETLALLSGTDTRFGDPGTNLYDYDLTMVDANVAAGGLLYVNYNQLQAGEDLVFDGSTESDGAFFLLGGKGVDDLTGGAGGDAFFFGGDGRFSAADRINGGAGSDQIGLRGNYTLDFAADTLTSVETLALLSAQDTRFAAGGAGFAYDIGFVDANVAAGTLFVVNAAQLAANETVTFDGSAESDGVFTLLVGKGADVLIAGAGNDLLYGGLGADRLTGGGGGDTFLYRSAAESSGTGYDTLVGFDWQVDRINLPGATPGYGGTTASGSLSTATFDTDMAAAVDFNLGPGTVAFFTPDQGTLSGRTFMVVDANGQAGYQAGQDYVFEMANPVPIEAVNFFV